MDATRRGHAAALSWSSLDTKSFNRGGAKAWFAGELRRAMFVKRNKAPLYRHCVPRVPATLKAHVMQSQRVTMAIRKLAADREVAPELVTKEAANIIDVIGYNVHGWALRSMAYMMHKIMHSIYQDIKIVEHELEMVKSRSTTRGRRPTRFHLLV